MLAEERDEQVHLMAAKWLHASTAARLGVPNVEPLLADMLTLVVTFGAKIRQVGHKTGR